MPQDIRKRTSIRICVSIIVEERPLYRLARLNWHLATCQPESLMVKSQMLIMPTHIQNISRNIQTEQNWHLLANSQTLLNASVTAMFSHPESSTHQ
jgi:hypothetical protein